MEHAVLVPPLEMAWAAGLFEGEGSVMIRRPGNRHLGVLTVSVVNTDTQIVAFFQERWPGYCKRATGQRPEQRPAWVWLIAARQAAAFLDDITPYLRSDRVRRKAALALEFQDARRWGARGEAYRAASWDYYRQMLALNQRGVKPLS